MRWLRITCRLPAFVVITLFAYLALLGTRLIPLLGAETKRSWRASAFRRWALVVRRLIGMRVQVDGPLPGASTFVVTNHLGYVDVVLLASFLSAVFVAKAEVASWPLLGRAVSAVGTIFVDRNRRHDVRTTNASILQALERGDAVVLFAEGTSSAGERVLPMQPSLLNVPATQSVPVTYAAISYQTPAGAPSAKQAVCWWGDAAFFTHFLALLGLPGFDARLRFGDEALVDSDRKSLALRLQESISTELAAVA